MASSCILSLSVCIPLSGWLAERYGTRRVFLAAVALLTLISSLSFHVLRVDDGESVSKARKSGSG